MVAGIERATQQHPDRVDRQSNHLRRIRLCDRWTDEPGLLSPIQGGLDAVSLWLLAPSLADVDWGNLITVVITLIAVEVIVRLWFWLSQVFGHMKQQRHEQTAAEPAHQSN
jgi:hypothetical protein